MKLILIRHGKTLGNFKKVYLGSTDESLVAQGIEELKSLRITKKYPQVNRLFSSPMKRATETAKILYPFVETRVLDGLKERSFGDFEYKNYEELKDIKEYVSWIDCNGMEDFGNTENYLSYEKRTLMAFFNIVEQCQETDTIAIISHGGTIMCIMNNITNKQQSMYNFQVENGNGYIITVDKSELLLKKKIESFIKL